MQPLLLLVLVMKMAKLAYTVSRIVYMLSDVVRLNAFRIDLRYRKPAMLNISIDIAVSYREATSPRKG
jgi:hypothetical protein